MNSSYSYHHIHIRSGMVVLESFPADHTPGEDLLFFEAAAVAAGVAVAVVETVAFLGWTLLVGDDYYYNYYDSNTYYHLP